MKNSLSIVVEQLTFPCCVQEMLGFVVSPEASSPRRCCVKMSYSVVDNYQCIYGVTCLRAI
jgi:hypothetical protein